MAFAPGIETFGNLTGTEPFHFARPEWLREGRMVEVAWIDSVYTYTMVTQGCVNADGEPFTFQRRERTEGYEYLSVQGEVTKAFPKGEVAQQEAAARIAATLHIRPFKEPAFNDDGTLRIVQPPTKVILLDQFDDYMFTALQRPCIPIQR